MVQIEVEIENFMGSKASFSYVPESLYCTEKCKNGVESGGNSGIQARSPPLKWAVQLRRRASGTNMD